MAYIGNKKSDAAKGYWQQVLIEMMGAEWKGQPYIVGYRPKTAERFDIGFNYEVGSKWPIKGMPAELWKELEKHFLEMGCSVSWQEGKSNLHEYIDWLNSCRLVISNDSLGMHLAFALNKKVIGLFGPTDPSEVYCYGNSRLVLSPTVCPLRPCLGNRCESGKNCMSQVIPAEVEKAAVSLLQAKAKVIPHKQVHSSTAVISHTTRQR